MGAFSEINRLRIERAMAATFIPDYITVGDDGTILAGTIERGIVYIIAPQTSKR